MTHPMKVHCVWNENLQFTSTTGVHAVVMDAKKPVGGETAATPKELLLAALCACTAMDVIALLRKQRQAVESFSVEASADVRESHPVIFSAVHLTYKLKGPIDIDKAKEAVRLSETRYCAVSAMLSAVVPINYSIEINGEVIGRGESNFSDLQMASRSGAA